MADIQIQRAHTLGFAAARKLAFQWAEQVETEFDMECTYEEGDSQDVVTFTRSGVNGVLNVTDNSVELSAKLGFLLGAFKGRIEGEIVKNLDALLASKPTAAKPATTKPTANKSATPKPAAKKAGAKKTASKG